MGFDRVELSLGFVMTCLVFTMVALVAGVVGHEAWRSGAKQAAYKAYTECLHEMEREPIDVKQTFCSRIRDQL